MIHAQCKACGTWAVLAEGDAHQAVDRAGCACCPLPHHHGDAANAPGAAPCRPVTLTLMAAGAPVKAA